jgi:hypothetical protein
MAKFSLVFVSLFIGNIMGIHNKPSLTNNPRDVIVAMIGNENDTVCRLQQSAPERMSIPRLPQAFGLLSWGRLLHEISLTRFEVFGDTPEQILLTRCSIIHHNTIVNSTYYIV